MVKALVQVKYTFSCSALHLSISPVADYNNDVSFFLPLLCPALWAMLLITHSFVTAVFLSSRLDSNIGSSYVLRFLAIK